MSLAVECSMRDRGACKSEHCTDFWGLFNHAPPPPPHTLPPHMHRQRARPIHTGTAASPSRVCTGAVISPAGLATGQPSTRRTSSDAQERATSVVPEVRMRP